MKHILSLAFIFAFSFATYGQAPTKEEIKAQEKAAKKEAKERLKQPPQVQINAPKEKVKPLLIGYLLQTNFTLEDESDYRVVASRPLKGFGESLMGTLAVGTKYGSSPKMFMNFTLNEISGVTTVILVRAVAAENVFGKSNSASLRETKKSRPELEAILAKLKVDAEK